MRASRATGRAFITALDVHSEGEPFPIGSPKREPFRGPGYLPVEDRNAITSFDDL